MTTPVDNSNITDQDVLDAKLNLQRAKNWKTYLEKVIAVEKKYLDDNKPNVWPRENGRYSNGTLAILQGAWGIDIYQTGGVANKPPISYIMTVSEQSAFSAVASDYYGGSNNVPATVWIQPWTTDMGNEWKPELLLLAPHSLFYGSVMSVSGYNGPYGFVLNTAQYNYWVQKDLWNRHTADLIRTNNMIARYQEIIDEGPEINILNMDGTLSLRSFIGLTYNVGSVQEAYLSSRTDFLNELATWSKANSPSAVTNASQLWADGKANKGMIQPYTQLLEQNTGFPQEVNLPSASDSYNAIAKKMDPTGFQFLYNPASVNMMYSGMLGVDPNFEANGLDQFNPLGVYTQATVDFNILINRMFDFKYYDRTTGQIADKYKNSNLYYPRQPELAEQRDIFKKGTMYDVEFLLRAVLGFGMASYLGRNMSDGKTADLGFITGVPVELHLGNNLRYLGNVTQLNVSHVLFDERMVPIFTNLAISFARLVDPVGAFKASKTPKVVNPSILNPYDPITGKYKYPKFNGGGH